MDAAEKKARSLACQKAQSDYVLAKLKRYADEQQRAIESDDRHGTAEAMFKIAQLLFNASQLYGDLAVGSAELPGVDPRECAKRAMEVAREFKEEVRRELAILGEETLSLVSEAPKGGAVN